MEEELKPILCIVCLNVKTDENCTVVEEYIRNALDALLLKLPPEETNKSMICETCYIKVFEAFRFKATCTDTEECICPYVHSKNGTTIDLKEIYLEERGKEQLKSVSEDEKICRLCMQIATSGFTFVKDIEIDLIRICIPEVNFNFTEEPVACTACFESLKTHSSFLSNCFGVQKFERVYDEATEDQFYIKTEEIQIKSEGNNGDTETPQHNGRHPNFKTEAEYIPKPHQLEPPKYTCDTCGYQTNVKNSFSSHQLRHKKLSEVTAYKCGICDFATKFKGSLSRHQATSHGDNTERYKCDICNYTTIRKGNFKRHQLMHEDTSAIPTYMCGTCPYETMSKGNLKLHQLTHKNSSVVLKYECDTCSYVTKRKESLKRHQLVHKDISRVRTYKCGECDFVTKYGKSLANHSLRHKSASEVQMYSCASCSYHTMHKEDLVRHLLTHKDVSEVRLFNCDKCDFATKYKSSLVNHELMHKSISEIEMYKCDKCSYETKRKGSLRSHQVMHKNVTEVEMYKCYKCDYETKRKGNLKDHQLVHK